MLQNSINFILPGFYSHFKVNKILLLLFQQYPEWFIDNIQFTSIYDSFPYNLFEGGRNLQQHYYAIQEEILEILNFFNIENKLPIRLVCTNSEIKPNQFTDIFSNIVLQLCENNMNEILIGNNKELELYIAKNYPLYSFISSTTKQISTFNSLIQELQKYKFVCLNYNFNNQMDFLLSIPLELRNKCELLCNEICPSFCKFRKEHYREISQSILEHRKDNFNCPSFNQQYNILHPNITHQQHNISLNQIEKKYIPINFNTFKLQGRQFSDIELVLTYSSYFIKPLYKNTFILEILSKIKMG